MAETQPGGLYQVGDQFVDAEGKPAKKQAAKEQPSAESASGFDVETATRDELAAEAERRGLTVTRADGKDGQPLVSDYQAALK